MAGGKRNEATFVIGAAMVVVGVLYLVVAYAPGFWTGVRGLLQALSGVAWPFCIILSGVILIVAARRGSLSGQAKRRMYRSRIDRRIGGVCGGLAEYCSVEAVYIRLLTVALFIVTFGLAGLLYIIFWASLPENPDQRV